MDTQCCRNCSTREIGCHSKCEKYKAFKEAIKAKNEYLKANNYVIPRKAFLGNAKTHSKGYRKRK